MDVPTFTKATSQSQLLCLKHQLGSLENLPVPIIDHIQWGIGEHVLFEETTEILRGKNHKVAGE